MKLTRENICINLKGKSKEELTELYWLLKNNNNVLYRSFERFLEYSFEACTCIGFCKLNNFWQNGVDLRNRTEVTIQQLKEILQSMETKEYLLITEDGYKAKEGEIVSWVISDKYNYELSLCEEHKTLIENSEGVYKVFIEKSKALKYHDKMLLSRSKHDNLTLTEQLEKAEVEVKRLKEAIEESNKIKIGDFIYYNNGSNKGVDKVINIFITDKYKYSTQFCMYQESQVKKITDQDLINKLNELIK